MKESPFTVHRGMTPAQLGRRRSTRVECAVPLIVSGRDASGQAFREATQTTTVNLHGARLWLNRPVLVGMQLTLENPPFGKAEKAICVRVEEPSEPGGGAYVAVQLVKPGNIWGLENPPPDWLEIEQAERAHQLRAMGAGTPAQVTPKVLPEAHSAEFEQRIARCVDTAVHDLQSRIERILQAAVRDFERQMQSVVAAAEAQLSQRAEEALSQSASAVALFREEALADLVREATGKCERRLAGLVSAAETRVTERGDRGLTELDAALATFRADLSDELAALREKTVESTEAALRERITAIFSSMVSFPSNPPGKSPEGLGPTK
jgi:hypothetical protein